MLAEPRRNTLGRTLEVVEAVVAEPERFDELLASWLDGSEWGRLRAANAVKRVAAADRSLVASRLDVILGPVAELDQPSARWTVAQLIRLYVEELDASRRARATEILRRSLTEYDDWIVLTATIDALSLLAASDDELEQWLLPRLSELARDPRTSVSGRARKRLEQFG